MSTQLYPLKFKPILKGKIWGGTKLKAILGKATGKLQNTGESWELSGVGGSVSLVENGFLQGNNLDELIEIYMGDLVGEKVYSRFGNEFPLLVKFIDASEALSIQVHPGDELASERHGERGKTEMWYVMQADENAYLVNGFNDEITPGAYVNAVESKTLETLLAKHPVLPGDVFFIPAGRVHAIGAGILLAEIQQTSDITYRIHDFDREDENGSKRDLHTGQALAAIDFHEPRSSKIGYKTEVNRFVEVVKCQYFVTSILDASEPVERDYYHLDSFVIYICVEGSAVVEYGNGLTVSMNRGETILIPASLDKVKVIPEVKTRVLEVFLP